MDWLGIGAYHATAGEETMMGYRQGPYLEESIDAARGRRQALAATINSLLRELRASLVGRSSEPAARHEVALLEATLEILLTPALQYRPIEKAAWESQAVVNMLNREDARRSRQPMPVDLSALNG